MDGDPGKPPVPARLRRLHGSRPAPRKWQGDDPLQGVRWRRKPVPSKSFISAPVREEASTSAKSTSRPLPCKCSAMRFTAYGEVIFYRKRPPIEHDLHLCNHDSFVPTRSVYDKFPIVIQAHPLRRASQSTTRDWAPTAPAPASSARLRCIRRENQTASGGGWRRMDFAMVVMNRSHHDVPLTGRRNSGQFGLVASLAFMASCPLFPQPLPHFATGPRSSATSFRARAGNALPNRLRSPIIMRMDLANQPPPNRGQDHVKRAAIPGCRAAAHEPAGFESVHQSGHVRADA